MAWYLAPSLAKLRDEVNSRWPQRDKASDGTIGDEAHQETRSDHNPNARESVNAWDMDKDGVDVWAVIDAFQRHPSAHYWIWNRQIADRDNGFERRPYSGVNPHTHHVHFSIRQTAAAEQDTRSWGLEADMDFRDGGDGEALIYRIGALVNGATTVGGGPTRGEAVVPNVKLGALDLKLNAVATAVAGVAPGLKRELDEIDVAVATAAAADAQRYEALRQLLLEHESGQLSAEAVVQRIGDLLSGQA